MPQNECNECARRSSEQDLCTIRYKATIFNTLHRYLTVEYVGWRSDPAWQCKTLQPDVKNPVTQVTIDVCSTSKSGAAPYVPVCEKASTMPAG